MAGIAGWMALTRHAPEDAAVAAALEALAHRGPDAAQACSFATPTHRVVLGQRGRCAAAPAMACDEAAGLAATLDGEIYNAVELNAALQADGERPSGAGLLLRAYLRWDKEFVRHLRGRFALALWDARKARLLLARDRFGEKPLYRCESNGSVFFASEAKALLCIPGIRPEVDLHAVREVLVHGYVPGPRTLFSGIRKLPPGTCALWEQGLRREQRYWTPPDRERPARQPRPQADAVAGFVAALEDAVKERMGDEPAGAFLSGGLDSSLLLALMSRHQPRVKTYTVRLDTARSRGPKRAARVAQHFGAEHHELSVTLPQLVAALPRLVALREAPLFDAGDLPLYLLAREAARSVRGVLTGEGADALLAGRARHLAERLGWPLARGDWRLRCVRALGGPQRAQVDRFAGPVLNGAPVLDGKPPFDAAPDTSRLRRALYFEQASFLPDNLLERTDHMAMAAALEARLPFVEHRLAEYVSALPDAMRVRGLRTKWLLRQAARRVLPAAMRRGAAARSELAVGEWLRTGLRDMLIDHLHGADSITRAYYHAPMLDRVLAEHLKGRRDHQKLLWTLLNLEIWHRSYRPG